MYFDRDSLKTVRVKSHGKGIFSTYSIKQQPLRGQPKRYAEELEWNAAIISVYPGGDSLLICRGNTLGEAYVAEKKP